MSKGTPRKKKLGDVLKERGHISEAELQRAIQEQQGKVILLGELLLQRGVVAKQDLVSSLESVTRTRYMDGMASRIEPDVLELVPRSVAVKFCVMPLYKDGRSIVTVMAEPQNLHILDELRFVSGMEIAPRLGFRKEIMAAIEKNYPPESAHESVARAGQKEKERFLSIGENEAADMEFLTAGPGEWNRAAAQEYRSDYINLITPAVRLVSGLIAMAAKKKASDIHIEPQANGTMVRIRVDGVLRELTRIPDELQAPLISRIKILADMDIAERRAPQDGRILVQYGSMKLDLRVSTLPTHYGEKVVIRLLDPNTTLVSFSGLGLSRENSDALAGLLAKPQGMLLVTGPTGAGKTTTLYAMLNALRTPTVNIITVEDPIEYMVEGVNQVQVNIKAGRTFTGCLRSILRQDPNVIMVGEVRDAETAEIALKAAQTGHLVLSTLHTNDAAAAITRLFDLGIPPFLVAASLSAILAQRLARRLCSCKSEAVMSPEYAIRLLPPGTPDAERTARKVWFPVGCPECDNTGYKGRVGIYEILIVDEKIRAAIRAGARLGEIRSLAVSRGMKLMQEDAIAKVRTGTTTLEEVMRVVPFEQGTAARCSVCGGELMPTFMYCPFCGAGKPESQTENGRHSMSDLVDQGVD